MVHLFLWFLLQATPKRVPSTADPLNLLVLSGTPKPNLAHPKPNHSMCLPLRGLPNGFPRPLERFSRTKFKATIPHSLPFKKKYKKRFEGIPFWDSFLSEALTSWGELRIFFSEDPQHQPAPPARPVPRLSRPQRPPGCCSSAAGAPRPSEIGSNDFEGEREKHVLNNRKGIGEIRKHLPLLVFSFSAWW